MPVPCQLAWHRLMEFPNSLVGCAYRGGYMCRDWELRVTSRCAAQDLGAAGAEDFSKLARHDMVKALIRERSTKATGTREITPLTSGRTVYRLANGELRGGTWYDEVHGVIWLLVAGRHRSGDPEDPFQVCKRLDREGRLFPSRIDYDQLERDRAERVAVAVAIEAPLLLRRARIAQAPVRARLGGAHGVEVELETGQDGLEFTTLAIRVRQFDLRLVQVVLAAFHGPNDWDEAVGEMPSRPLDPDEIAFRHLHEAPGRSPVEDDDDLWRRQTLISIRRAVDRHNGEACPVPAREIWLHPAQYKRLQIEELWGFPVVSHSRARENFVRIDCEGSAHTIEEELAAHLAGKRRGNLAGDGGASAA